MTRLNLPPDIGEELRLVKQRLYELERRKVPAVDVIFPGAVAPFDAMIDSRLDAADVGNHRYPNLSTLAEFEVWPDDYMFTIGVRTNIGIDIIETDTIIEVPGPFAMIAYPHYEAAANTILHRQYWELNGCIIRPPTTSLGYRLEGLYIENNDGSTISSVFDLSGTSVYLVDCVVDCFDGATRSITNLCGGSLFASNCGFKSIQFAGPTYLANCVYENVSNTNFNLVNGDDLIWIGGILGGTGSATITLNNGEFIIDIDNDDSTIVFDATGGSTQLLNFTNATGTVNVGGNANPDNANTSVSITIASSCDDFIVKGCVVALTVATSSTSHVRSIDVEAAGLVDISGPALVRLALINTAARAILRGVGIRADIMGRGNPVPMLDLINCDDSLIHATLIFNGVGVLAQPYNIDAASTTGSLYVTGAVAGSAAPWPVAGANAGTVAVIAT